MKTYGIKVIGAPVGNGDDGSSDEVPGDDEEEGEGAVVSMLTIGVIVGMDPSISISDGNSI
jgi:hypothetical protein